MAKTTTTRTKTYLVRNQTTGSYLRTPYGNAVWTIDFAFRFPHLAAARASAADSPHREVLQLTYGLRWYSDGKPLDSYVSDPYAPLRLVELRKDAYHFDTEYEARQYLQANPILVEGFFNDYDKEGLRVVKFLRRVS